MEAPALNRPVNGNEEDLGMIEGPTVLQVNDDASGPECVVAEKKPRPRGSGHRLSLLLEYARQSCLP